MLTREQKKVLSGALIAVLALSPIPAVLAQEDYDDGGGQLRGLRSESEEARTARYHESVAATFKDTGPAGNPLWEGGPVGFPAKIGDTNIYVDRLGNHFELGNKQFKFVASYGPYIAPPPGQTYEQAIGFAQYGDFKWTGVGDIYTDENGNRFEAVYINDDWQYRPLDAKLNATLPLYGSLGYKYVPPDDRVVYSNDVTSDWVMINGQGYQRFGDPAALTNGWVPDWVRSQLVYEPTYGYLLPQAAYQQFVDSIPIEDKSGWAGFIGGLSIIVGAVLGGGLMTEWATGAMVDAVATIGGMDAIQAISTINTFAEAVGATVSGIGQAAGNVIGGVVKGALAVVGGADPLEALQGIGTGFVTGFIPGLLDIPSEVVQGAGLVLKCARGNCTPEDSIAAFSLGVGIIGPNPNILGLTVVDTYGVQEFTPDSFDEIDLNPFTPRDDSADVEIAEGDTGSEPNALADSSSENTNGVLTDAAGVPLTLTPEEQKIVQGLTKPSGGFTEKGEARITKDEYNKLRETFGEPSDDPSVAYIEGSLESLKDRGGDPQAAAEYVAIEDALSRFVENVDFTDKDAIDSAREKVVRIARLDEYKRGADAISAETVAQNAGYSFDGFVEEMRNKTEAARILTSQASSIASLTVSIDASNDFIDKGKPIPESVRTIREAREARDLLRYENASPERLQAADVALEAAVEADAMARAVRDRFLIQEAQKEGLIATLDEVVDSISRKEQLRYGDPHAIADAITRQLVAEEFAPLDAIYHGLTIASRSESAQTIIQKDIEKNSGYVKAFSELNAAIANIPEFPRPELSSQKTPANPDYQDYQDPVEKGWNNYIRMSKAEDAAAQAASPEYRRAKAEYLAMYDYAAIVAYSRLMESLLPSATAAASEASGIPMEYVHSPVVNSELNFVPNINEVVPRTYGILPINRSEIPSTDAGQVVRTDREELDAAEQRLQERANTDAGASSQPDIVRNSLDEDDDSGVQLAADGPTRHVYLKGEKVAIDENLDSKLAEIKPHALSTANQGMTDRLYLRLANADQQPDGGFNANGKAQISPEQLRRLVTGWGGPTAEQIGGRPELSNNRGSDVPALSPKKPDWYAPGKFEVVVQTRSDFFGSGVINATFDFVSDQVQGISSIVADIRDRVLSDLTNPFGDEPASFDGGGPENADNFGDFVPTRSDREAAPSGEGGDGPLGFNYLDSLSAFGSSGTGPTEASIWAALGDSRANDTVIPPDILKRWRSGDFPQPAFIDEQQARRLYDLWGPPGSPAEGATQPDWYVEWGEGRYTIPQSLEKSSTFYCRAGSAGCVPGAGKVVPQPGGVPEPPLTSDSGSATERLPDLVLPANEETWQIFLFNLNKIPVEMREYFLEKYNDFWNSIRRDSASMPRLFSGTRVAYAAQNQSGRRLIQVEKPDWWAPGKFIIMSYTKSVVCPEVFSGCRADTESESVISGISIVAPLRASPSLVRSRERSVLSWHIEGAKRCALKGSNDDGTEGSDTGLWEGLWRSVESSPITEETVFTLKCFAATLAAPAIYEKTVKVNVIPIYREF